MSDVNSRLWQILHGLCIVAFLAMAITLRPVVALAAPYAAMVIDARTGKVLHSRNADTQLHPASLTKMMTLYLTFQAVEHGDISLDTMVTISANAAAEPPSKLGLRAGQRIKLRYLIRAAAIKSANDAATALAEAVGGSEAAFVRRMNRMAKAMGMTRTTFKNANGLTRAGHVSTARDMTTLGRHLLYDFPQYYNLFSRRKADAGVRMVANTNRRFLDAYRGADGIKTGYTAAAGFNLVASAQRGNERIIATLFGGKSTASRNAKVADLLDLGFRRAPTRVTFRRPQPMPYFGSGASPDSAPGIRPPAGRTLRLVTAVSRSPRPEPRPVPEAAPADMPAPSETLLAAIDTGVEQAITPKPEPDPGENAQIAAADSAEPSSGLSAPPPVAPRPRPTDLVLVAAASPAPAPTPIPLPTPRPSDDPEIVTHISSSGGGAWGIDVGVFPTQFDAERVLLKTALSEIGTLGDALRKANGRPDGWHANFIGLSQEAAELACRRLEARATTCTVIGPG